ncbi:hypothetical protein BN970_02131 [Mycolicibacterium conceptionense]|uniref:Uncharacterized protein n=1 Tax=Mycolicibacterium conceptionense TaxID=451644 RepID=A0A0U1DCA0_9MYCO|nr:hypothetical protein BN970_02131 [Mycolicibacterium conceptionense]
MSSSTRRNRSSRAKRAASDGASAAAAADNRNGIPAVTPRTDFTVSWVAGAPTAVLSARLTAEAVRGPSRTAGFSRSNTVANVRSAARWANGSLATKTVANGSVTFSARQSISLSSSKCASSMTYAASGSSSGRGARVNTVRSAPRSASRSWASTVLFPVPIPPATSSLTGVAGAARNGVDRDGQPTQAPERTPVRSSVPA